MGDKLIDMTIFIHIMLITKEYNNSIGFLTGV